MHLTRERRMEVQSIYSSWCAFNLATKGKYKKAFLEGTREKNSQPPPAARVYKTYALSLFLTYQLWNTLQPRIRIKSLLRTSALTRIVLGLVDHTGLSEPVPCPQSPRGRDMLDFLCCFC